MLRDTRDTGAEVVRVCTAPGQPATRALAKLLLWFQDLDALEQTLAEARQNRDGEQRAAVDRVLRELADRRGSCAATLSALRAAERELAIAGETVDAGVESCRRAFDAAVQECAEASVALCSLGDPRLLATATAEVVAQFATWELLGPDRIVLQIGCGTGRFEAALAPYVREAHGVDISPQMLASARERCAGLANVQLHLGSGRDLSAFPRDNFDLVYAVDSMPYLVRCGDALVARHFLDAARLLRPRGCFVILNYSYRGNPSRDDDEVCRRAGDAGFEVCVLGDNPFAFWDGRAYVLRRIPS